MQNVGKMQPVDATDTFTIITLFGRSVTFYTKSLQKNKQFSFQRGNFNFNYYLSLNQAFVFVFYLNKNV